MSDHASGRGPCHSGQRQAVQPGLQHIMMPASSFTALRRRRSRSTAAVRLGEAGPRSRLRCPVLRRAVLATPASSGRGQAAFETLAITLILVAGFWGLRWMHGEGGALAVLVQALRLWHERFANLLAIPV